MNLNNKHSGKIIVWVLLLLLIGGGWLWLHQTKAKKQASNEVRVKPTLTVETTQIQHQQLPDTITLNGNVSAWQEAIIGAEINGLRIKQVLVEVGNQVKKGQLLAQLADEAVLADMHKQQAMVARDKANLTEAKANAERARGIKETGAMSAQQIQQYFIAEETATANLAASQAELENQQLRLKYTRITAPDDGVISARTATLGSVVNMGAELFRLVRQSRVEWRAEANATQISQIKVGQTVGVSLPNGEIIQGKIRMLAPTLDNASRNALVYVDIPNRAKAGMYLEGHIHIAESDAFTVPQSAIVLRDGHSYVFEILPAQAGQAAQHHLVAKRMVTTGRMVDNQVEITQGLDHNATIVASGGAFLNDRDTVKVIGKLSVTTPATEPSHHGE